MGVCLRPCRALLGTLAPPHALSILVTPHHRQGVLVETQGGLRPSHIHHPCGAWGLETLGNETQVLLVRLFQKAFIRS